MIFLWKADTKFRERVDCTTNRVRNDDDDDDDDDDGGGGNYFAPPGDKYFEYLGLVHS